MSARNVTCKLIESHLESGKMRPGEEIALKIDQTLTQDATGVDSDDCEAIESGDELKIDDVFSALDGGDEVTVENRTQGTTYTMTHGLSARQIGMIRVGSLVRQVREES